MLVTPSSTATPTTLPAASSSRTSRSPPAPPRRSTGSARCQSYRTRSTSPGTHRSGCSRTAPRSLRPPCSRSTSARGCSASSPAPGQEHGFGLIPAGTVARHFRLRLLRLLVPGHVDVDLIARPDPVNVLDPHPHAVAAADLHPDRLPEHVGLVACDGVVAVLDLPLIGEGVAVRVGRIGVDVDQIAIGDAERCRTRRARRGRDRRHAAQRDPRPVVIRGQVDHVDGDGQPVGRVGPDGVAPDVDIRHCVAPLLLLVDSREGDRARRRRRPP